MCSESENIMWGICDVCTLALTVAKPAPTTIASRSPFPLGLCSCENLFLRTSTCFNHPALLEKYGKTVRDVLFKVCKVNFDDISSTQLSLPAEMGGLGVSSASLLALPAFLVSAFGASAFSRRFSWKNSNVSFSKELE